MPKIQDLTHDKYSKLTVIQEAEPSISKAGRKTRKWLCKCECG